MASIKQLFAKLSADVTAVPTVLQAGHLPVLDGARGLAIILLLWECLGVNYYSWPIGIAVDSSAAVHIFFVLSGFLITTLLLKEQLRNGRISLSYFYLRRALRILPVAWSFLLVLALLNYWLGLQIRLFDILSAGLFFNNMPVHMAPLTAHFWSLAVAVQFYLLFPAILAFNQRLFTYLALAIVIVVPLVSMANYFAPGLFSSNNTLHLITRVCSYAFWRGPVIILIGAVFAILIFKNIIPTNKLKVGLYLGPALLLLALVIRSYSFMFYTMYVSEYFSAILIMIALVMAICRRDLLSRLLSSVFLTTLGTLSYSIYIWQQLFVGPAKGHPLMQYFTQLPVWGLILVKLVFLAIIVSFSFVVEAKFLKLKDKFHYARKVPNKKAAPLS